MKDCTLSAAPKRICQSSPPCILFSTYIFLGLVLMAITLMQALGKASKASVLVLLRQIVLFVPLVLQVPRLGGLGINGPLSLRNG